MTELKESIGREFARLQTASIDRTDAASGFAESVQVQVRSLYTGEEDWISLRDLKEMLAVI